MYLYGRGYISGADEVSKPDNDFFILLSFFMWFQVFLFNPLNY